MAHLILTYTLKPNVTPQQFEDWIRTVDYPAMRSLKRVKSFTTYRAQKLLMSDDRPDVDYVELFEIPDLNGFLQEDLGSTTVQTIMQQFMGFAAAPQFIVAEAVI